MSGFPLDDLDPDERKYFITDMQGLLRGTQPRRFLWFVLQLCGIYQIPGMGLNAYDAGFINGQKNVGIKMIAFLEEIDPTLYPLLLLEHAQAAPPKPKAQTNEE